MISNAQELPNFLKLSPLILPSISYKSFLIVGQVYRAITVLTSGVADEELFALPFGTTLHSLSRHFLNTRFFLSSLPVRKASGPLEIYPGWDCLPDRMLLCRNARRSRVCSTGVSFRGSLGLWEDTVIAFKLTEFCQTDNWCSQS